jgi:hypothetical protein
MAPAAAGGHRLRGQLVGKVVTPLGQYFLASAEKADESIAAPKGHGPRTPAAFPLQTGRFLGTTTGAMMSIADPRPAPLRGQAAVVVGEGHA